MSHTLATACFTHVRDTLHLVNRHSFTDPHNLFSNDWLYLAIQRIDQTKNVSIHVGLSSPHRQT